MCQYSSCIIGRALLRSGRSRYDAVVGTVGLHLLSRRRLLLDTGYRTSGLQEARLAGEVNLAKDQSELFEHFLNLTLSIFLHL